VSRAVRLSESGQYSQKADDHDRVGDLPDHFEGRERFANRLRALRLDRNLCDYDHEADVGDLTTTVDEWTGFAREFVDEAARFLKKKGVRL
jgi:hypothetical protein